MVSRELFEEESDLFPHPIARDGVGIIVHQQNSIGRLSSEQIRRIYQRQLRFWQELGGATRQIVVVNKAEGRATLEVFRLHFGLEVHQIRPDIIVGDNEQGIKVVAGNPDAIGYVSIGTAEHDIERGVPIRLLPLEGVSASSRNVASGSYPMARTLNLVLTAEAGPGARKFVDFAQSSALHSLLYQLDFVPIEQ
jgi:phosphate transport system substrate-binding protein